jgi:phosphoketolase
VKYKPIPFLNGKYKISKNGVVVNSSGKVMKTFVNTGGYIRISLIKDGKKSNYDLHQLVALTYIPNPKGYTEIDHLNNVRTDNRIQNLRWVSRSENNYNKIKK